MERHKRIYICIPFSIAQASIAPPGLPTQDMFSEPCARYLLVLFEDLQDNGSLDGCAGINSIYSESIVVKRSLELLGEQQARSTSTYTKDPN